MTEQFRTGKSILARRVIAFIIDFIFFGLFFLLMNIFFNYTVLLSDSYLNLKNQYNTICVESNLYNYTDLDKTSVDFVYGDDRDEAIEKFYIKYQGNADTYYKAKDAYIGELFYKDSDGKYQLLDDYNPSTYNSFLTTEIKNAYYNVLLVDPTFAQVRFEYNSYTIAVAGASIVVPYLLLFYVLPLIFKQGQTLGYKAMGLSVYMPRKKEMISEGKFALRFLILTLGYVIFFIPNIVSVVLMMATKDSKTIHDMVVDSQVIYIVDEEGNGKNGFKLESLRNIGQKKGKKENKNAD
jgi:uncharacterized RDD family membrane protein YckC